jgi:hypothetical protein
MQKKPATVRYVRSILSLSGKESFVQIEKNNTSFVRLYPLYFALVLLMELGSDQIGQSLDRRRGVGPSRFEIEPAAALRGERGQLEDALAVVIIAVVMDPNLGLKLQRQLHELVGGPHVEAEFVRYLHLSTRDSRVMAHRRLDRRGPETSGERATKSPRVPPAVSKLSSKCALIGFLQDVDDLLLRPCLA